MSRREDVLVDLHQFAIELLPYVTARVARPEDAADVLQIALLDAVLQFDKPAFTASHPRAYFWAMVRQRLAGYYRRRRYTCSEEVPPDTASSAPSPEDDAIAAELTASTHRILKQLAAQDRKVLTRFYLHEKTKEQICVEMKLTFTQFRLLKSRALIRLRKHSAALNAPRLARYRIR
jgi:RNA polymerase sigma factor (sigma-70 family)